MKVYIYERECVLDYSVSVRAYMSASVFVMRVCVSMCLCAPVSAWSCVFLQIMFFLCVCARVLVLCEFVCLSAVVFFNVCVRSCTCLCFYACICFVYFCLICSYECLCV